MSRHLNRAATLLLLCLGIYPQIWMIIDTLNLSVDPYFPLWLFALCVFTWCAAVFRPGLLLGLPLSALTLYAAYRFYDTDLLAELFAVFDKITGVYYEHIFAPGDLFEYSFYADSSSLILLFLGFLLSAYLAAALTSQSGRVFMSCLGTVPFFAACIAVNGRPPVWVIVGMLLFWSLLLASGSSYQGAGRTGQAVLFTALPVLTLLCVLLLFNNPDEYHIDQRDIALSQRFDQISQMLNRWFDKGTTEFAAGYTEAITSLLEPLSDPIPPSMTPTVTEVPAPEPSAWRSGTGAMDLTVPFDLESAENLVMDVRVDVRGTMYLRSSSYGTYAGDHWEPAEEPSEGSSLAFSALSIASGSPREHQVDLRPHTVFSAQHLPYFSLEVSSSDSYVPAQSRALYSGRFYSMPESLSGISIPAEFAAQELRYREFAYRYYTQLPDYTRQVMLSLAAEAGIRAGSPDLVQQVADYVQAAGEYDLYTAAYPSDDYAVYFLTQAHRGYCVHFATAAAAMYRALGVPARVTDGYLLLAKAGEFIPVTGANAHAWVEVYRDGFGWLPIEVTGQNSADAFAELDPESLNEDGSGDEAADTGTTGSETEAPSSPDMPVGILQGPDESSDSSAFSRAAVLLWAVPISIPLLLLLWFYAKKRHVQRRISQPDLQKAAVSLWRCANRVAKYGPLLPDAVNRCAEKAVFSRHPVTEAEYAEARAAYEAMLQEAWETCSLPARLYLKYFCGLR